MNKKKLAILERAYSLRIGRAVSGGKVPDILQMKSKAINELVEEGCLIEVETILQGTFPVKVKGYVLTPLGEMLYCESCKNIEND